jgi:NDP-sugar pyrophosphorylase family protein
MVHKKEKTDITIFGSLEDIDMSYGILESDEKGYFCRIKEKPNLSFLVNTGIYILNPSVIDLVEKNERLDMPDLIDRAKKEGMNVKVFPVPDKMTDIGQWEYYKKFL